MEKESYDYLFKFILIGNTNTGKSCLLHYFLENKFKKNSTHTIGVEFGAMVLKLGTKNIKLQIWDTAGQERFRSVASTYYRGALGALILYDITNQETFNALGQWLKDARDMARPDICVTVVGNKCDLKEERKLKTIEAAKFCQENGVQFVETSAMTGENVQQAFVMLAKNILDKIEGGLIDTTELKPRFHKLNQKIALEKGKKCCSYY